MTDSNDDNLTYRDAGVDLEAADEAVDGYRDTVESTQIPGVLDEIGGFGGLFSLSDSGDADLDDPVLVSGTDGVGTKLRIAFRTNRHDTIGIDCVAMCVNDVVTTGARPLFFLDYLSTGELEPGRAEDVVRGLAAGCRNAGCALLGGETAEMPGFYPEGEYDMAGFCVGIVDRETLIRPEDVEAGDAIVGLASTGIHSNGFSLVREVLNRRDILLDRPLEALDDERPLGEVLLEPTRMYSGAVDLLQREFEVHGLANITGGGLPGNVPRALPDDREADIDRDAWQMPEIFAFLHREGNIPLEECYRVFNMGIGFTAILPDDQADEACELLAEADYPARIIGTVR
ncbi:MAG: phosphoribosylformylglycinamidine cyclo-ligase [Bradymonadaceae bacterium]